jgi:photosystem II stability/assembly factor-like uncharacterized protein
MSKAILAVATDNGVSVLKPGTEATDYVLASRGLVGRKCGCICRSGDGRLVAGTQDFFVQISRDGQEWKPSMTGIARPHITALARHPKHKHLLLAGTCPPAVYLSADFGTTWAPLAALESLPSAARWSYPEAPYRARVSSVACHAEHNGVVFCSIENGEMAASKDGGKSWMARGTGLPTSVRQFSFPPGTTHRVYAAASTGFFRSDDLGATWTERNHGLPFTKVEAMAVAASHPDIILLSVASATKGPCTVVLSKDGAASWTVVNTGLPRMDNRRVTSLTFGTGGFFAGTDQGEIYLLDNLEGKWKLLMTNLSPIRAILALT